MTTLPTEPAADAPPIQVDASPLIAQAGSTVRVVVMVVTGAAAIIGFLGKRDITGLVAYLQSDAFVPLLAILIGAGTYVWGQIKLRRERAKLVVVAHAAPDDVAIVMEPPKPGRPVAPKHKAKSPPPPPGKG